MRLMAEPGIHADAALPVAVQRSSPDELTQAALRGEVDRVRIILDQGVHPDSKNKHGRTALQTMSFCCPEIAKMLLEKGADPNVQDCDVGRTPLHDAIAYGTPDMVKCLLENGADVGIQDFGNSPQLVGNTPVHLAVKEGKTQMITVLEQCSSFRERNNEGQTPYDLAMANDNVHIARRIRRFYRTQSLKSKCRVTIRRAVGRQRWHRLNELEPVVSRRLAGYLMLQD